MLHFTGVPFKQFPFSVPPFFTPICFLGRVSLSHSLVCTVPSTKGLCSLVVPLGTTVRQIKGYKVCIKLFLQPVLHNELPVPIRIMQRCLKCWMVLREGFIMILWSVVLIQCCQPLWIADLSIDINPASKLSLREQMWSLQRATVAVLLLSLIKPKLSNIL